MDDAITPYELREADCSGRALATLVVAWVGAALVASVLLKWTHMWVALAVLTLLFLIACAYAACDARRTQERALAREAERQEERRRRRAEQLESVSGGVENSVEPADPPEYETYWVADLPPSYTAAVNAQAVNGGTGSRGVSPEAEEQQPGANPPRLSNPPPYAIAVQSEPLFLPIVQNGSQNHGSENTQSMLVQSSIENGQTSSQTGRLTPAIPLTIADQDKVEEETGNGQNTVPATPTRTQYLTSILSSTFGRNARRTNNNNNNNNPTEVQSAGSVVQIINEAQNNRNREQSLVNNSNNDRNINSNQINGNGTTPPPQYPVTRMSDSFSNC